MDYAGFEQPDDYNKIAGSNATQSTSRLVPPINANEFKTLFDSLTDEGKVRFGEILQGTGNIAFTQFSTDDTAILRDLSTLLTASPETARANAGIAVPIAVPPAPAGIQRPAHTQAQTNPSTSSLSGSSGSGSHAGSNQNPRQTPAYENIRFEHYVPPPEQDAPAQGTAGTGRTTYNGPIYNYSGPVYNGPVNHYPGYQQPMNYGGVHQAQLPGHGYIANGYNQHNAWGAYGTQHPNPYYTYGYALTPSAQQSTSGQGADHYSRGPLPPVLLSMTQNTGAPSGYYQNAHYDGN
ncbi:hypothetical protein NMY22_g11762 [Coprinellus aureogranulatus]|nr:hypothetical protein NMY22_g11762 [Coprinellus aureogranulatus]